MRKYSLNDLLKNRVYFVNLIVMNVAWSAASFCYYMIGFYLNYIPGDDFNNILVASLSEFFSCIISGFMAHRICLTRSLFISFLLGLVAAIPLIFIRMANDSNT